MNIKSTNLIPLAGLGQRFADAGYRDPKPLIKVSGLPMIVQATRSLPKADSYVFICLQEHLSRYPLAETIKAHFPNSQILGLTTVTQGQASTCLQAKDYVDNNHWLTIGACDNSMLYNAKKWQEMVSDLTVDAIIWTFRNNPTVVAKPQMYGWVEVDAQDLAKRVACKVPLSKTPLQDHAIVGTFSFRKAANFFDYCAAMIAKNRRINNEFYVDECMNLLIEGGLKIKVFEVDQYICWGTPNDLKTFEYWQNFFAIQDFHPYKFAKDKNFGR